MRIPKAMISIMLILIYRLLMYGKKRNENLEKIKERNTEINIGYTIFYYFANKRFKKKTK